MFEQPDREHAKRIIGSGGLRFTFAFFPGPFFGVFFVRVTWNETYGSGWQWNSRQRTKFIKINAWTGSDWSCANKISSFQDFEIFGVVEPVAGLHITFLFRNAKRSFQDRTKPWHTGIDQAWGFLKRWPCANVRRPRTRETYHRRKRCSSWRSPSPGITLRCNHSTSHMNSYVERRKAMKFAPANEIHEN